MALTHLTSTFVTELDSFVYTLSSTDRVWNILFPAPQEKWHHLHINQYQQTYYITHISGDCGGLEAELGKDVKQTTRPTGNTTWELLLTAARQWLKVIRKDWIKANKKIQLEYPLRYRYGIAPNALIRASLPDVYRLDQELGEINTAKLVQLVETGFFHRQENTQIASMTATDYFHYCKIAYIAGKRQDESVDESLSGREMYARYADGRHEGLLDIDPNSAQEFADWIDSNHPLKKVGGHPWEIKRGGNTTHINLAVTRPPYQREGFKIELRGESISRMVETMHMLLAIHAANLPISIANPEGVRKRLLVQDNIGIVPAYTSLHRANQHFGRGQDIFDVMHYDALGRFKRRITPFITWEPLPILKPRDASDILPR